MRTPTHRADIRHTIWTIHIAQASEAARIREGRTPTHRKEKQA